MGTLAAVERSLVWGGVFGIADRPEWEGARDNFRPALMRPARLAGALALRLTEEVPGDPEASRLPVIGRRRWGTAAIVIPNQESWRQLVHDHPYGVPFVAATSEPDGQVSMVGRLSSYADIGTYQSGKRGPLAAHAMRIGPDAVRFGLGVYEHGEYHEVDGYLDLLSATRGQSWVPLEEIGHPASAFQQTHIS